MIGLLAVCFACLRTSSGVMFPSKEAEGRSSYSCGNDTSVAHCLAREAVFAMEEAPDQILLDEGLCLVRTRPFDPMQERREGRNLLDMVDGYLGERALEWNLGGFYPGLMMKVTPDHSSPYLSFVLDESKSYDDRRIGTGRMILKRALLPLLLGLKISLVSLVPVIVGALILIAKKSLFLSKLSLLFSSASVFWNQQNSAANFHSPQYYYKGADKTNLIQNSEHLWNWRQE